MLKNFELHKNLWLIILISFATIALQNLKGTLVLSDPFHQGEYFASAVIFFTKQIVKFTPLTIHGALDFIPALIAKSIWRPDSYFLPTYFLYKVINITSALLLLAISIDLTKGEKYCSVVVLSIAIAAPQLVGYRDLVLLISFYLFLKINNKSIETATEKILLIAFGVVTALGLFWSFDRGIAGVVSFGIATLFMASRNKKHIIAVLTFLATVIIVGIFSQTFSFGNYIENIKVLLATSSQWSYGWQRGPVINSLFAIIFNLAIIGFVMIACYRNKSLSSRLHELIILTFLSIFMLKIGINRADWSHVYWCLWAPTLMVFIFKNEIIFQELTTKKLILILLLVALAVSIKDRIFLPIFLAGLIAYLVYGNSATFSSSIVKLAFNGSLVILLFLSFPTSVKYLVEKYQWLVHIYTPPSNIAASTEGMRWVSDRLLKSKSTCVFDLSNNGIINGLTTLPSCSRFTYPVYAGLKHESELIDAVRLTAPQAIVYSSTYWSYSIDGRSMRDRFPQLDTFLIQQYPRIECANGYCIRYLKD